MVRRQFSGVDICKVLINKWGFVPVGDKGDHRVLRYENSDTGEIRTVTVPMHAPIKIGTLRDIAEQAGANDFDTFCREVDKLL
jgi:predicted RNA binding protein YcfA (HicA-like mRNA interferase family)